MAYLFKPPTVDEGPVSTGRLFGQYKQARGISVLVTGSTVVEKRYPSQDEADAADVFYIGGHEYLITDTAAAVLADAGYADNLEMSDRYIEVYEDEYGGPGGEFPLVPSGYYGPVYEETY